MRPNEERNRLVAARGAGAIALARGYAEQQLAVDPQDREARQLLGTLQRRS